MYLVIGSDDYTIQVLSFNPRPPATTVRASTGRIQTRTTVLHTGTVRIGTAVERRVWTGTIEVSKRRVKSSKL